jgi:hypothetical protein
MVVASLPITTWNSISTTQTSEISITYSHTLVVNAKDDCDSKASVKNMSDQDPENDAAPVKVLLLKFAYTDLEGLDEEADDVYRAFRGKGYDIEPLYEIKMQNPWDDLRARLGTFLSGEGQLRILYYHGHGDFSFRKGLELFR